MKSEAYVNYVPDMSGQSPYDSKGNYREYVLIKVSKPGQSDRFMKMPFYAWSTSPQNRKKSYQYFKLYLVQDDEYFYVKCPSTFDKSRLMDKIEAFLEDEYGERMFFEFVGQVHPSEAIENCEWRP